MKDEGPILISGYSSVSVLTLITSPSESVLLFSYSQLITILFFNLSMEKATPTHLLEVDKKDLNILGSL